VFKVKLEKPGDDPILGQATLSEMEAMVPVYRTPYQLGNSIRQFIERVLKAKHGKDWWNKSARAAFRIRSRSAWLTTK
jgi:hypothetical protein